MIRAMGNPIIPYIEVRIGISIHDIAVQYNINLNVVLTFPNELKRFVKGLENDEKKADMIIK